MSENPFAQFVKPQEKKEENPFAQFVQKSPEQDSEQGKGFLGHTQDAGASLMKGLAAVPETIVGLADIPTGGRVGKFIEQDVGLDLKGAKEYWGDKHTDQYKAQQKQFDQADGIVDKTKVALSNPSMIFNTVVQSTPEMLLGGAAAKGLGMVSKLGAIARGALSEGAVMAGHQASAIRGETEDGLLTPEQSGLSVATGALGSLFGYAGGRLAQKMGLSDVDTAMQTGRLTTQQVGEEIAKTPMMAIPTAMIKGAISEGFLEELPQSVSEQILQNLALDKPWHDGVENAAVMGTLAGMAMGGTVSGVGKTGDWWNFRQDDIKRRNEIEALRRHGKLQEEIYQRSTAAQQKTWNEQDLEAQQRLQDVYQERSRQAQNDAWIREDIQNHQRYLEQPIEQMGNLGNRIGTGVNPNNDPDAPITPNSPNPDDNSPNGNYFDGNYGSEAAFDDLLNAVPPANQTPSQQMGINPNDGPMSSAAALAVDSGASPIAQLGYTPEQQSQEQSNTPISDAVPSSYQSLLGSQNDVQPFNANLEDATVQQGNAQADNAGKSISQQYDTNAADAMGGAIETDTAQTTSAQTVQPILGQDGKNKWFGTQEKAQAFIDKKDLGNDYQVVQDGKRFEIQPKAKSPVQDDAYFQSKLDQLDKQRAQFESSGDYASAEKVYGEMQTVAREWQTNSSTGAPTTKRAEPSKGASDNAWGDFYRKNRNMMSEELFMGGHQDRNTLEEATPEIQSRHAHGMAKATPAAAVRDLKDILENDIDQNRGQGRLFTAPLSQGKLTAEQRSAMSASGTSSGSAYSDGAFTLIAKEGVGDIRSVSEIDAVMVNSAVPQEVVNGLRQDFPNMKFGYAKELPSLLSGGKQSNNAQTQVAELEQQLKNEKSVSKKAQIRKQIAELQNGLTEQAQSTVSLNQPQKTTVENLSGEFKKIEESTTRINAVRQRMREANPEIFTAENDRVRETHGLTNARVTSIADEIETSGNYELSDREYEKIKNNPNYKIDYDARNFIGKVTAVKDPHSGEWVGNNEQSDLDNAAHEAATSVHNDLPEPTQAQIEAGNYKKGHIKVHGLDIAIENPRGSERRGTDPDGNEWSHNMSDHYGYIKRTTGADQEHIDTYVGKNPESENVFIVDQIDQGSGGFDEHKVMLGFDSQEEAITAYKSNFDKGWKVGPVTQMSKDQFKDWLKNSDTSKPVAESGQKTEPQHPVNKWQAEMQEALSKADPEHPLFKKLQASAKNGLRSVSDRAVALRQAREIEKKAEAQEQKYQPEKPKAKAEPSKNTLVSDDRAAELRARLKAKLSQLNSGIDPEIMAIGAELAVYHIERGARKFAALAKNIANDLDVSVEKIRPYLRSWYNGARDMMEDMGADIQGMDNAETVRAELAKLDNPQQDSNTVQGKTETVVTPSGREFEVQHKVVEADELITSNLDSGAVNAEYPQALQPRDRTTLKSVTQINDIANKLNPKLLGDSASSTNGAPIVSPDSEVESGNGRTLAIRKAYQTGKADAYKAWLAEQGYDVANMQQPILVRERITPMNMAERVAYTTESNERDTLDMSPSEQAMSDAPKVMDILHLVQGGSFNNTANRDFVNAFLTGVASKNERGTMLDKDGVSLTQDGYRRIEAALLAAAFNDAQIISQVIESKDSDIKAIGNALIEVAPQWAQVRKGVQEGILVEGVNIEANLVEAVHLIRKARQQNLSLSEMLNQDDMFDGSIDQVTKDLVSIFYRGDKLDKARSSQKVAEALKSYAQLAMTAKASPNLFGDAPLSTEQILGQVHDRLKQSEAEKQQDIFSSPQPNEPDTGTVGGGRSGRGTGPRSETAQEQSEPTKALKKTAPTSEKETIQDFGEKIEGAKKDAAIGMSADVSANDIAQQPLSKVWDANAYKKDENKIRAAFNYVMRGELPAKPRVSYRVKAWVDKVLAARDAVNTFSGRSLDELSAIANENGVLGASIHKVMLLQDIPVEQWARIGEVREYPNAYGYDESGYKITSPKSSIEIDGKTLRFGTGSILDAASKAEILEKLGQQQEKAKPKTQLSINDFGIYRRNKDNSLFITRKADKEKRPLKEFEAGTSSRDVQQWLRDNLDLLSQTWEDVKNRDNVGKGDMRNDSNRERAGRNWRDGKDVSDKDFMDAFGFRGVQFGNWVKQQERQQSLNEAFDALHDLASILNIPTKAISLGGELGLAFGARGSGKAMAHFERSQVVINLTKTKGAGSLAHEWFHALDNYFSRQRGKSDSASREDSYITYKPEAMYRHKSQMSSPMTYAQLQSMHKRNPSSKYFDPQNWQKDPNHPQGVRPVVEKAFADLVDALNASPMKIRASALDNWADKGYWSRIIELAARTFENYVISKMALDGVRNDYLANVKDWKMWQMLGKNPERYPYLKPEEEAPIVEAFDNLFSTIETVEDDKGNVRLFSRKSGNQKTGKTIAQVREALIKRFGKATIEALEKQGKLEIIQDYQVEGVEGYYRNGKAVLVASNLNDDSIIPTFLHELGGHAGFQNMMKPEQYADLMRQFDRMVEQGNPIALEAKKLAEREQGSERQQLEYLPYLLTLASNTQIKHAVHKGNITRLISDLISKVKAWIYDRLGVNLNLNPNDMVALAERMVDKAATNVAVNRNGHTQYSLNENSQDFTQVGEQIKKLFHQAVNGDLTGKPVSIGRLSQQGRDYLQQISGLSLKPRIDFVLNPSDLVHIHKDHYGTNEKDKGNNIPLNDDDIAKMASVIYQPDHVVFLGYDERTKSNKFSFLKSSENGTYNLVEVYGDKRGNLTAKTFFKTKRGVTQRVMDLEKSLLPTSETYFGTTPKGNVPTLFDAVNSVAGSNDGTENNQPLYSRQSMQDTIDKLSQNLKSLTIKSIKDKSGDKKIDWLGIGLSALGRRQLTEIYAKLLPQLNKYNELAAQMDADKNDAAAKADSIVREWSNLNDEEALANVMHDSTLAKIDPTKPHVSGDSISKYRQLRDAYNSLSPEAQAMYVKARDAYKKHYAEVHQAIKERIQRSKLSNQKKADLLKQMDDNFFGYVKGVYFPLARFGRYIVVMRNQNGEVESVSRAETMGEARALRSELMKKYPDFIVKKPKLDKEYNKSRDAVGRGFMSNLFDEVGNLGMDEEAQAEFKDTLGQLYLSSLPDLSWAKHGIHRKGTAGFSQNARRAFAQNMFSGANYLAKLRYGDQLAQQLDEMQKYADEKEKQDSSYDQPTAQSVIDEMNKRHDNLMNPKGHPLSSALTSLGFIYYLGLSPAAAMVNLSQTVLVAYPLMGAKWDFDKAASELKKAAKQFRKSVEFHKPKWGGETWYDLRGIYKTDWYKTMSSDISQFLNEDEKKAYQEAVNRGVIDVTQAHDLAGIAQGEDSGVMWKTRPIMRAASVMFHSAERFNREVTFIASYRLARQHGADHNSAFDQAVDMTYKGHFDYSSGNRPRIMQGNVAKVVLLFKQFGQNMLYTLARQTYQSIKGETKEERREARRAISAILAMHATFAGALGLPMVGMLLSVASWMGGDDDDPWDAEVALRNYLAEASNPTISNMLMKGAPRGIGVDISSRVGINNLLLPDVQEGLEGKKWWDSAASAALGPIGGIGANVAKGAQEISEGHNLRGVESMLPVFLKNFAKAYRYADEGVQDKTGVSILDEVDSMDLLIQSMGFSPADVRTANEGKSAIYQYDRKLSERRSRLMTLWSRAKMLDDQQEMDEIWEEIQGFNEKNPLLRITRINLNQSYRQRQRRIDRAEDGIYLPRNRQDARDAGYFAFGE